jgi:hypothetical protein
MPYRYEKKSEAVLQICKIKGGTRLLTRAEWIPAQTYAREGGRPKLSLNCGPPLKRLEGGREGANILRTSRRTDGTIQEPERFLHHREGGKEEDPVGIRILPSRFPRPLSCHRHLSSLSSSPFPREDGGGAATGAHDRRTGAGGAQRGCFVPNREVRFWVPTSPRSCKLFFPAVVASAPYASVRQYLHTLYVIFMVCYFMLTFSPSSTRKAICSTCLP